MREMNDMADINHYRSAELANVVTKDGEIRLKIMGSHQTGTKWLNITPEEFDAIAQILTAE